MENSKKNFIEFAVLTMIGMALVGVVFYYFYTNSRKSVVSLPPPPTKEQLLAQAKLKVKTDEQELQDLKNRYDAEQVVISKIGKEYSNVRDVILKRIDVMFSNPNSDNPTFKIKLEDENVLKDILERRSQINKLLAEWNKKNELIRSVSTSPEDLPTLPELVKSAESDMEYIRDYVGQLNNIISNLTPANSNLTSSQIKIYSTMTQSILNKAEVAVSDVVSLEPIVAQIYQPPVEAVNPNDGNQFISLSTSSPEESSMLGVLGVSITRPASTSSVVTEQNPTVANPVVVAINPDYVWQVEAPPIVTLPQIQTQQQVVNQSQVAQNIVEQSIANQSSQSTTTQPLATSTLPVVPIDTTPVFVGPTETIYYRVNYDTTGWPDLFPVPVQEQVVPSLLQGSNQL